MGHLLRVLPGLIVVGAAVAFGHTERVQAAGGGQTPAEERLTIETPRGSLPGAFSPGRGRKAPVVVVVTPGAASADRGTMTEALTRLRAAGIGTLTYAARDTSLVAGAHDAALWVAALRNDVRSGSIAVLGVDEAAGTAAIAARAGRADGLALMGAGARSEAAARELERFARIKATLADPAELEAFVRAMDGPGVRKPRRPETERRSLRDVVLAEVDGVRVSIEYGRPSKRGRDIWGALVPFGRWWMPGADEASTLTTSGSLTIGDLAVPAGDYTIYTLPRAEGVDLIINGETDVFHLTYNPQHDLGRVRLTRSPSPEVIERLTFMVEPSPTGGGTLALGWDDRVYRAALKAAP